MRLMGTVVHAATVDNGTVFVPDRNVGYGSYAQQKKMKYILTGEQVFTIMVYGHERR